MTEGMIGFIIWGAVSLLFIGIGVGAFFAKDTVGFWSNTARPEVTDVKGYNRAVGKLWIGFAILLFWLGTPLLAGENSPLIVITMLGTVADVVMVMAVYTLVIERKYKR